MNACVRHWEGHISKKGEPLSDEQYREMLERDHQRRASRKERLAAIGRSFD
jgi:hypothetical protein